MSPASTSNAASHLEMHEGRAWFSAGQAMLKGLLESDREVSLLIGPDSGFSDLFSVARDQTAAQLLRRHGLSVVPSASIRRDLMRTIRRASSGDSVVSLVPNGQLHTVLDQLQKAASLQLSPVISAQASAVAGDRSSDIGGALCLVLEDDPDANPTVCPRNITRTLDIPCIEPATVAQLRDAMDQALRLSRAGSCAVAIIVHQSLLASSATMQVRPNRVHDTVDVALLRLKRRQRITEAGGLLRMARRMELNHVRALPSPGERVAVGFITFGPADAALQHLTQTLRLHGRVPVLHMGLLHPIDDVLVERFLTRCEKVVVLEPRPGSMHAAVLNSAEALRRRGGTPAGIWGRLVPPAGDDAARAMQVNESIHISLLARRIIHLLHPLRPALKVTSKLAAASPELPAEPAPRGAFVGEAAARAELRSILADVDQRLRAPASDEQQSPTAVLAINGASPPAGADRVVTVETCAASEFLDVGVAAAGEAVAADKPSILIILDLDGEPGQIERIARSWIATDFAERVEVVAAALTERAQLRDQLHEAALRDTLSIIIVRDGKPPRYSLAKIERDLSETDRLGFEPRQWLIRPADEACAIRDGLEPDDAAADAALAGQAVTPGLRRFLGERHAEDAEISLPAGRHEFDSIMRSHALVEKVSRRQSRRMRVKVQPLLEQIEVIRTRPPAWVWQSETRGKLELPKPLHARQSVWRAHLAGWRGSAPGVATRVLCEAGRNMGYEVSTIHDDAFIAAGCHGWSQVLFTRAAADATIQLASQVPYGEADVLLALQWEEALRAITPRQALQVAHPDRTCSLVNCGSFQADHIPPPSAAERTQLMDAIGQVSRDQHCTVNDYAAACRTWFYTDRVTDLAMLGAAFQQGLIPVRLDAMEAALRRIESAGYGRSFEAFHFGRWLAADERLLPLGRKRKGEEAEDLHRITRRMVLSVRMSRWGGRGTAKRFRRLLEQCLVSTPGLAETASGRQAQRDMVAGLYRCLEWGGMDYANRYAQLLMALYRADRGDKGRAITRDAVLPLAEAMLVRDQVYVACMAASPERRRRLHAPAAAGSHGGGLNVKRSRGDRVERRYLTRLEFIGFGRRYRLDLRTSDWPARVAKASQIVLPQRWRGSRRDRELREYVIDFIQRATHGCARDYDAWSEAMHRLHHHAVEHRLRSMAVAEVRMLAEG